MIVTKKNRILIAADMIRIVHGGRGDYMEIDNRDIVHANINIPPSERWRVYDEGWANLVYYDWWETTDGVKLYYQKKLVNYADYKIGFWYVDPSLVEQVAEAVGYDCSLDFNQADLGDQQ